MNRRGFFQTVFGGLVALLASKLKLNAKTLNVKPRSFRPNEYLYRGYWISVTPVVYPAGGGDPIAFARAYPTKEIGGDGQGIYVPILIEPIYIDVEYMDEFPISAEAHKSHLEFMVDRIMDNPNVRNLSIKEWDEFLGYDGWGRQLDYAEDN